MILFGIRSNDFKKKNPYIVNFYQEEEIDNFNKKFSVMITTGISLYIINFILVSGLDSLLPQIDENEYLEAFEMSFFFLIIAIATAIIVYFCTQKEKYDIDKYNQLNDKNSETYKKVSLTETVCGCICCGIASIIINSKRS